ncbi:MAG: hypothetical protein QOE34_1279 [Verrucomicrobiota bacterium]|jgi:hypothetical protein
MRFKLDSPGKAKPASPCAQMSWKRIEPRLSSKEFSSRDQGRRAGELSRNFAMITGAHSIIYSRNPEVDRAFFGDVLKLTNVDVGHGWLIFGLPPAEVAVHPGGKNGLHEFYLMCDDVEAFVAQMKKKRINCGPVRNLGWGLLSELTLPGGGKLGVYQPRHARPKAMREKKTTTKKPTGKKSGKRQK